MCLCSEFLWHNLKIKRPFFKRNRKKSSQVTIISQHFILFLPLPVWHQYSAAVEDMHQYKLHALVYDILPSTTAVFSYAIGSRKLSANEQFFVGAQTVVFVTSNSDYSRHLFYNSPCCLRQLKSNQNHLNRDGTNFLPRVDASYVYVHAWVLGSFHSLISTQTFWRPLTMSADNCAEIKRAPSVV